MQHRAWKVILFLATLWVSEAGQFRHGMGRGDSLKVKIPALPLVRIGRATISIEVKDAGVTPAAPSTVDATTPITQLQAALDQAFQGSFTIVQSNGEAQLRVAVVHYTPAEIRQETLTRKMVVGAAPNADGTPQLDPQTGRPLTIEKSIAVEQWTAHGQISARVEVVDSSGVLLDAFAPQASVRGSQVISVGGQDRVDRAQIPTGDQVKAKLIADLIAQLVPRYCPPAVEAEIPLAVDEELRPGNQLAKQGDYAAAAKSWQEAALKKEEGEGDRRHNLGAVYEAQGYGTLIKFADPAKAEAYFEQAGKHYASALEQDPKEKYISRAGERVRKVSVQIAALKELEQKRQSALIAKTQPSPWPPGTPVPSPVPAPGAVSMPAVAPVAAVAAPVDPVSQEALNTVLNDSRPDVAQEVEFRQFIRLRLRSMNGPVAEEGKPALESAGPLAYSLSSLQAKRVVHQETAAWNLLQPKFSIYRDSFAAFVQDGRISPAERGALQSLAKNLNLLPTDIGAIESMSKFVE